MRADPLRTAILAAYAALIAFVSLAPSAGGFLIPLPYADKIFHAAAYGILNLVAIWTFFSLFEKGKEALRYATIGVSCFLYGIALEVLQGLMPYGRVFSIGDGAANAIGIICSTGVALIVRRPVQ